MSGASTLGSVEGVIAKGAQDGRIGVSCANTLVSLAGVIGTVGRGSSDGFGSGAVAAIGATMGAGSIGWTLFGGTKVVEVVVSGGLVARFSICAIWMYALVRLLP